MSSSSISAAPAKASFHESDDANSSSWSLHRGVVTSASDQSYTSQQPPYSDESLLEKTAEEASELFSSTIKSLTHDVRALGHLTTWKDILEEDPSSDPAEDDDRREAFLESLCDLDDVVSSVEKKVGVLRQIVAEEQQALENLNLLHKDSMEQNENLEYLVERCLQIKANSQNMNDNSARASEEREAPDEDRRSSHHQYQSTSSSSSSYKGRDSKQRAGHHQQPHTSKFPSSSKKSNFPGPGRSVSSYGSNSSSLHAHAEGLMVYLDRVTQEELETVPRTTRGRVQVPIINEAIDNIEKAFYHKTVKERKQIVLLEESKQVALCHYNNRSLEKIPNDEELIHSLVVSEEELRQTCASFFLAGELNARTSLAVLKALRRIKQVPATKGRVLYKLCL